MYLVLSNIWEERTCRDLSELANLANTVLCSIYPELAPLKSVAVCIQTMYQDTVSRRCIEIPAIKTVNERPSFLLWRQRYGAPRTLQYRLSNIIDTCYYNITGTI